MAVRIVTDSSCDLSQDEADQLDVLIVPLSIRFGTEEFTDRVDLSVDGVLPAPLRIRPAPRDRCAVARRVRGRVPPRR